MLYLLAILVFMVTGSIFVAAWGFLKFKQAQRRVPEYTEERPFVPVAKEKPLSDRMALRRRLHAKEVHEKDQAGVNHA
jgi:hypothetical protein